MEPSISSDPPSEPTNVLKRSLELEGDEPEAGSSKSAKLDGSTSHQHLKQTSDADFAEPGSVRVDRLVADLEDELWCPLCAAVLYRPVIVSTCSHAFCGNCLSQYLRSSNPKPHTCPSCRSNAQSATHSRTLSALVDVLIRHAPDKKRAQAERDQADDEWAIGESLRFGHPPPPPSFARAEVYRPCRHCAPGNGWTCPIPVPAADSLLAYPLDGPCPEGHLNCSSCSQLAATAAPTTRTCGVCEAGYCGITQTSCTPSLLAQTRPGMTWGSSATSLAESIYDPPMDELACAFKDNIEELRIFGDFISNRADLTPAVVYAEIIEWVLSPEGQDKGGVRGVFRRVDESLHSNLTEGRAIERMCLPCSDDLFACGLYEWWARKRPEVFDQLDKSTRAKPDCKNGRACFRQGNAAHSRKFNHICSPLPGADTIEQDDHPLPVSPPVIRSSSPSPEARNISGDNEDILMAPPAGEASHTFDSHPSSDGAALDNVDLGIGPSGTSGADDDDDGDDNRSDRAKSNLVEAGVQTDERLSDVLQLAVSAGSSPTGQARFAANLFAVVEGEQEGRSDMATASGSEMAPEDAVPDAFADSVAVNEPNDPVAAALHGLFDAPLPLPAPFNLPIEDDIAPAPVDFVIPEDEDVEDADRTFVAGLDDPSFFKDMSFGQDDPHAQDDDVARWMEEEEQAEQEMARRLDLEEQGIGSDGLQPQEQAV